ncbi:sugar ABC transporter ATP-binding protein [Paenibacillus sp. RC67]|uniref:sugar ABC transporter ATP-binding protein n=1 Tax=Paenibacillus sp. RC67 TaxID=3039392 RepID=UPI0024ADC2F1|nr:sugar ABC transporter ATP-binding protein [Paenibacillus sp. RC67]
MIEPLVEMDGIDKHFPGVHALNQCRFTLMPGEVHALVGENGAGKSTLMKVLTGVYQKDSGTLRYKGKEVLIPNTRTAQQLGISMIHQELNLMPHLTIAQNIFIGREPGKIFKIFLNDKKLNDQAQLLFNRIKLQLDPRTLVSELTVAQQQMVEIAKALSYQSQVLIMDEPTAALTDTEINDLFRIIRELKENGVGIVYISHRMEELKRITDRITVMRDGCYIDTIGTQEVTTDRIIAMMVGRELYQASKPSTSSANQGTVLEVRKLNRKGKIKDVSFSLRKGEILGFAGLMGAGRTEVARAIFGADPIDSGEIRVHGQKVRIKQPHHAVRHGIVEQKVKYLSGGNQQKVVISKWLLRDCEILIFDEPTRGIDVGAKTEIYKLLEKLAEQGKSIIMISSDLPEILRMSHRIMIMCEGRITGELSSEQATQESIMKYATMRSE